MNFSSDASMGPMSNPFDARAERLNSSPFGRDSASDAVNSLGGTMQSFRDSLAFSFQTLNLTLGSLSNSINNLGSRLSPANNAPKFSSPQWIQSGYSGNFFGGMSSAYANYAGSQSIWGLLNSGQPANVSPLEFWAERAKEIPYRYSNLGMSATAGAAEVGVGALGGYLGSRLAGAMGFTSGLAKFGLGFGMSLPFSAAAEVLLDPMVKAASIHQRDTYALQRMSARFRSPFTLTESQNAMSGIEDLAYKELFKTGINDQRLSLSGYRDIAMLGLQGNIFQGTSPDELVKQVAAAGNVVKFLTGVMGNKDVQETMQMVKQLKDMGINVTQAGSVAKALGSDALRYGKALGVQPSDLLNAAANASTAAYGQYGFAASTGMRSAMTNIAYMSELEKRKMLTPAEIAAGGGVQAMSSRLTAMDATMLASNSIGLPMLLAGWNGTTGFDAQSFKNASQGGYFGVVGQAATNMFRDGIGSIASAMAQQTNIAADLGNQGLLSESMDNVLRDALRNMPSDPKMTRQQRIDLATIYIQNFLQAQGQPVDMGTARAKAIKILYPGFQAGVERNANNQLRIGIMEQSRVNRDVSRPFEALAENWERANASVYENVIRRPARAISDFYTQMADYAYANTGKASLPGITTADMRGLQWANDYLAKNPNTSPGFFTNQDFNTAYERTLAPDSFYNAGLGLYYGVTDFFMGRGDAHNALVDMLNANMTMEYAGLWNRIASPDRMTKMEALARGSSLRSNYTVSDIERIFDKYKDNPNAASPVMAGAEVFIRGNRDLGSLETMISDKARRLGIRGRGDAKSEALLRRVLSEADYNSVLRTKGINKDVLFQMMGNTGNSKAALQDIASELGVSAGEVRGLLAQKFGYGLGLDSSLTSAAFALGGEAEVMRYAEAYASDKYLDRYAVTEGLLGTTYDVNNLDKMYAAMGLSDETIRQLIDTDGTEAVDMLTSLMARTTENRPITKGELSKYLTTKSGKQVSKFASRLFQEVANNGGSRYLIASPSANADDIKKLATQSIAYRLKNSVTQRTDTFLRDSGFKNVDYSLLSQGNVLDAVLSANATTDEAKNLQSYANQLSGYSVEQLNKVFADYVKKTGTPITSQNKDAIISQHLASSMQQEQAAQDAKVANKSKSYKSAIDTAVENDGGNKPYVRVKMVDEEVKTARDNVTSNTQDNSIYNNGLPPQNRLLQPELSAWDKIMLAFR